MKYIFVLFSCLFLYSTTTLAQLIPGYMGKRHFMEAGAIIGLNNFYETQATFSQSINGETPFLLAFRPAFSYNYVLSRKTNVHLGYAYSSFQVNTHLASYQDYTNPHPEYQVFTHDVKVGFDFYPIKKKPHMLAPVGSFLRLGVHVMNTNRALLPVFTKNYNYVDKENASFTTGAIELGYGIRTVLGNQFLLSFNVQTVIFPATFPSPFGGTPFINYGNGYHFQLANALQQRHALGANIAIGVFLQ